MYCSVAYIVWSSDLSPLQRATSSKPMAEPTVGYLQRVYRMHSSVQLRLGLELTAGGAVLLRFCGVQQAPL
jgi:hypothetical protein